MKRLLACSGIVLLAACNIGSHRQSELRPLYESARAVQAALNVGVSYQDFGALLTRMSTQLLLIEDRAKFSGIDRQERDAAKQYSAILDMYRDSATVSGLEIRDNHYDPQLPSLAAKHGVPDATGIYRDTQYAAFARIREAIWKKAAIVQEDEARAMFASGIKP
jgi:hypothetical protein